MTHRLDSQEKPSILIVDDTTANLRLLSGVLKESGYKVRPVTSGELALEAIRRLPPDMILLDINMPGMNGYEVCERLKADPALADIPVIFLSALNEMEDKVRAFRVGGVDYITKPFQFEEVQARVECQLSLRRLHNDMEAQNRALELTNRRLCEAEQLRDDLVHMVIHDMRSPLTVQMGFLDYLLKNAAPPLGESEKSWVVAAYETSIKLINMVNSLLDINRMESGKMPIHRKPSDLNKIAHAAMEFYRPIIDRRRYLFEPLAIAAMADCDEALIQRVIENLIGNAHKFTADTGEICISITQDGDELHVAVADNGVGIAPKFHEAIFTKFMQTGAQQRKNSTGVGLAFCKLAIETQGGRIGVNSEVGQGSTFWFNLPMA